MFHSFHFGLTTVSLQVREAKKWHRSGKPTDKMHFVSRDFFQLFTVSAVLNWHTKLVLYVVYFHAAAVLCCANY